MKDLKGRDIGQLDVISIVTFSGDYLSKCLVTKILDQYIYVIVLYSTCKDYKLQIAIEDIKYCIRSKRHYSNTGDYYSLFTRPRSFRW